MTARLGFAPRCFRFCFFPLPKILSTMIEDDKDATARMLLSKCLQWGSTAPLCSLWGGPGKCDAERIDPRESCSVGAGEVAKRGFCFAFEALLHCLSCVPAAVVVTHPPLPIGNSPLGRTFPRRFPNIYGGMGDTYALLSKSRLFENRRNDPWVKRPPEESFRVCSSHQLIN